MTYLEKAKDIYALIGQGKLMEAFEKYYGENVVMQELGDEPRIGKDFNRQFEMNFLASIKELHGGGVVSMGSNEADGVVFVENWMDMTYTNGVRVNLKQVCVQKWEGDYIVNETYYHNLFPMNTKMITKAFDV